MGSGEPHRDDDGEMSGLLQGVAVGEKQFRAEGVFNADGVTALMPEGRKK